MKIIRAKDYKDMSRKAANIISAQVIMKPNCVLGLATGGTPVAHTLSWWTGTTRATWISLRSPPSIWTSTAACPRSTPKLLELYAQEPV